MHSTDLLLLLPRSTANIDAEYVRTHAGAGASVVALASPAVGLSHERLLAYEHPHGVDLSGIDGFRLRDIVLVRPPEESPCRLLMLYLWNSDSSCYDIDAVRVSWDRIEGPKDRRNNPLGKNPTNFWDFDKERRAAADRHALGFNAGADASGQIEDCGHGLRTDSVRRLIRAHCAPSGTVHIWAEDDCEDILRTTVEAAGRKYLRIPEGQRDADPVLEIQRDEPPVEPMSEPTMTWAHKGVSANASFNDCRAGLAGLVPGTVTHVITSPPYNIGYKPFNVKKRNSSGELVAPVRQLYEDSLSPETYNGLIASTLEAVDKAASPERLDVFLNVKSSYKDATCVPPFYMLDLMPSRWELIDLIIWRYDISYDPARKKYKPVYEWVLRMGYGDIPRPKRHMTDWYLPIVKGNSIERRDLIHPAMFPLGLVEAALRESDATRPGSLVVDPFLGSGTTIAACINHGVPSVGFELSLDYKADIAHRMKQFEDIDKADPVEDPAKTAREPDTKGLSLFGWKDDKPKAP